MPSTTPRPSRPDEASRARRARHATRWSSARPALHAFAIAVAVGLLASPAAAVVVVSGPVSGAAFFPLVQPTGQFDERGLSGFEYFISGITGDEFLSYDQFLIQGEDTNPTQAIGADLGVAADLSGTEFEWSVQHNLAGGRNFTFSIAQPGSTDASVLCWGQGCDPTADVVVATLNGQGPLDDFNGIQVQVRAQDVPNSSATVTIDALDGVPLSFDEPYFDETVVPTSPGSVSPFDFGRRGQWFIAQDNDLVLNAWELRGTVTLSRLDPALMDRTQVRLAIDLVRDPRFPSVIPEPSTALLLGLGLCGLAGRRTRRA